MNPNDELVTSKEAARRLGVSRWVTGGIKAAGLHFGDCPFTGRYTTMNRLSKWLLSHPEFVASHWQRRPRTGSQQHNERA